MSPSICLCRALTFSLYNTYTLFISPSICLCRLITFCVILIPFFISPSICLCLCTFLFRALFVSVSVCNTYTLFYFAINLSLHLYVILIPFLFRHLFVSASVCNSYTLFISRAIYLRRVITFCVCNTYPFYFAINLSLPLYVIPTLFISPSICLCLSM